MFKFYNYFHLFLFFFSFPDQNQLLCQAIIAFICCWFSVFEHYFKKKEGKKVPASPRGQNKTVDQSENYGMHREMDSSNVM